MMLTCAKCGRKQPLSDDDVANFYPRFFCLSCGEKLPFDLAESELQQLRASNDRDRRLVGLAGLPSEETVRRVHKSPAGSESGG
jgi:hypothetical protein